MAIAPLLAVALLAAAPPKKIAVMDLEASGVEPSLAQAVSLSIPTDVRGRLPGTQVISKDDVASMLGLERTQQMLGCTDARCATEVGGAVGADELVSGRIGKVGDTYVLELKRIDVRGGKVLGSSARLIRGQQDALVEATSGMLDELFPGTRSLSRVRAIDAGWEPRFLRSRTAAWTGAVAGVALLGLGSAGVWWSYDVSRRHATDQSVQNPADRSVTRADADRARSVNAAAWAGAGVGAVLAAWGGYRLLHPDSLGPRVAAAPVPGGAVVALGGSF
jgi:hypothetical protein